MVVCVLIIFYIGVYKKMTSHSFDNIKSLIYAAAQNNDSKLDSPQGENPHYPNLVSKAVFRHGKYNGC